MPPLLLLLLLLLLAGALAWWLTRPGDAVVELRAHHGPLVSLEREAVAGLGAGLERWALIGEGRDTVSALWRRGAHPEPEWVVVLLGGIGTDDRAALLVPAELPVGVLAVSWPWKGSRRMSQVEFLARTHELRAALLETPGAIARGVEAARRAHPRSRVALIGASLGVPPTVAALALAKPDALVLVDGAADLARLLRSEVRRQLGQNAAAGLAAGPAAALGGRLLSSLEPSRFGAQGRDVPVLLVDAAEEERYPRACVERLHATFPHATRATHPGHHIRPENEAQVASVIGQAVAWLESLPRPATAAR